MMTTKPSSLCQFLIHAIAVFILLAPATALADVVYTTLSNDFSKGAAGISETHYMGFAFRTPPGEPYAIDSVRLNLWNNTNVPDPQFVVDLYDDNAGVPGSLVATIGTGVMDPIYDVVEVATPASPVALTADSVYWIMVYSPGNFGSSVSWFGGGLSPVGIFPHVRGPVRWIPSTSYFADENAVGNLHVEINASLAVVAPTYSVGGNVSGLTGTGLELQNNGADTLAVNADGPFAFLTELVDNAAYSVTVSTQPTGQTCSVTDGNGVIAAADVTNVAVTCTDDVVPTYSVGGTVSGLTGTGLELENMGADTLPIATDGPFTFATELEVGFSYVITVSTQPTGQTCIVSDGSGTISDESITDVAVTCTDNPEPLYTINGTVSGLGPNSVTLQNNGADDLDVDANGPFVFATALPDGSPYDVTILTQPAGQNCGVTSGFGTINGTDVLGVDVDCQDDVVPPLTPTVPVPTLSEWALILLTMLIGLMVFSNRRRLF